ncbi:MAG: 3-phosphoshikimate 1-carboxyvinyltransferase [Sulfurovum sp.]|nr:MAG: 3-phosphoshikimate 1-carboxyvinyltransferase [Sulfurovum sp.]
MKKMSVVPASAFNLNCSTIASDKSISHRCAMFSLLSDQKSTIENFLLGEDTLASLNIAQQLGATVTRNGSYVEITPPKELQEPSDVLDCGNAGTAIRLYVGLLSGIDGYFVLSGDKYLRARPMKRVVNPLISIGAKIDGRANGNLAPLTVRGGALEAFRYHSSIDSAQVKSAMILSALRAKEKSYYKENLLSRDHTERMLLGMGAEISFLTDGYIEIMPLTSPLKPLNIRVPSDPSSGFFFAVASAIIPNSTILLENLTLNKTRVEAYKILQDMGAKVEFIQKENIYEPIGDIRVSYNGKLSSVSVNSNIAWLIDELPALSIAMAMAKGTSKVSNAKELRVKESDRISCVLENLNRCGIETKEYEDGYEIVGGVIHKAIIDSFGDHRIAMSFAIAGLVDGMDIEDIECIETSFPNFIEILKEITEVL